MTIEKNQKLFFDELAEKKGKFFFDENSFFYKYANNEIMQGMRWLSNKKSLLDYGCGMGSSIDMYLKAAGTEQKEIYGIDLSEKCIDIVKKRYPHYFFKQVLDNDLGFLSSNSIESAYILSVLHHTRYRDKIFEELFRVIKPNGKLLVVDLTSRNPIIELGRKLFLLMPGFVKDKFSDDLVVEGKIPEKLEVDMITTVDMIKNKGFVIVDVQYGHLFLFVFDWLEKITRMKFSKTWIGRKFLGFLYSVERSLLNRKFFQKRAHLFSLHICKPGVEANGTSLHKTYPHLNAD